MQIYVNTHTSLYLDNGRDEFLREVVLYEVGPVVMDKVDDEALDMGAILVLIGHDPASVCSSGEF